MANKNDPYFLVYGGFGNKRKTWVHSRAKKFSTVDKNMKEFVKDYGTPFSQTDFAIVQARKGADAKSVLKGALIKRRERDFNRKYPDMRYPVSKKDRELWGKIKKMQTLKGGNY